MGLRYPHPLYDRKDVQHAANSSLSKSRTRQLTLPSWTTISDDNGDNKQTTEREPIGLVECDGVRLDPYAMSHDRFFDDLICGFSKLLKDTYRTVAGVSEKVDSGNFHVDANLPSLQTNRSCCCYGKKSQGQINHPLRTCPYAYHRPILTVGDQTLLVSSCLKRNKSLRSRKKGYCCCRVSDDDSVDVDKVARQFMYWFIPARARIQMHMPTSTASEIESLFRPHSESCGEDDMSKGNVSWNWRKHAIYKLVWELKNPVASRVGFLRDDGEPLRYPWVLRNGQNGDMFIHGVLDWRRKSDGLCLRLLLRYMKLAEKERQQRKYDPEVCWPDLWSLMDNVNASEKVYKPATTTIAPGRLNVSVRCEKLGKKTLKEEGIVWVERVLRKCPKIPQSLTDGFEGVSNDELCSVPRIRYKRRRLLP